MRCPLCTTRNARRHCPALSKEICALCCGTKRLVEIQCPADCVYLTSSREHPAAAVTRQQQQDITFFIQLMRGLNERQSQLLVAFSTALLRYEPPDFHVVVDEDVAEAAGALAATLETRSRGVIYDHRPASLPAERLMTTAFKPLVEADRGGGSVFEREAAVVLRRIEQGVGELQATVPASKRAYINRVGRVLGHPVDASTGAKDRPDAPRLILP